jgi:hypothetical protein
MIIFKKSFTFQNALNFFIFIKWWMFICLPESTQCGFKSLIA